MSDLDKFDYECQNQMSIFDLIREQIRITKPIRLIELFAGCSSADYSAYEHERKEFDPEVYWKCKEYLDKVRN